MPTSPPPLPLPDRHPHQVPRGEIAAIENHIAVAEIRHLLRQEREGGGRADGNAILRAVGKLRHVRFDVVAAAVGMNPEQLRARMSSALRQPRRR